MRQPNENVIKHNYNIQRYNGESYYFETCNQFDKLETYCWTKSYLGLKKGVPGATLYYPCIPNWGGKAWHAIDAEYVNPVTHPNSCGSLCQGQHGHEIEGNQFDGR